MAAFHALIGLVGIMWAFVARLKWLQSLAVARIFSLVMMALVFWPGAAWAGLDPLFTETALPPLDGGLMGDARGGCDKSAANLTSSVSLYQAVSNALCSNPKTLQAWASIQVQAAQVGTAKSAFFPTIDGSILYARDHATTAVPSDGTLDTNFKNRVRTDTLNLSWVLFDFGARYADLQNARQLLTAAEAEHAAALQEVFVNTAKDYYAAVAARASEQSTAEMQQAAQQSLDAASARVKGGVAPVTDQLQTQTAYAQAVFNHARAQGEYKAALGTLALDMGVAPTTPFTLAENGDAPMQDVSFVRTVDALLDEAKASNPTIKQAQAQLDAAVAKAHSVLAESMPSISLTARASRNNQPLSLGAGLDEVDQRMHDRYIGVQVSIPLFAGFGNLYKVKGAQAQVEVQKDNLLNAQQQVAQQVWVGYQTFLTNTENLHNTDTILHSARAQFEAAQARYHRGVTGVLELMSAQSTLSDALQQRIKSLADWRTARLQLAGSVGQLGAWALK